MGAVGLVVGGGPASAPSPRMRGNDWKLQQLSTSGERKGRRGAGTWRSAGVCVGAATRALPAPMTDRQARVRRIERLATMVVLLLQSHGEKDRPRAGSRVSSARAPRQQKTTNGVAQLPFEDGPFGRRGGGNRHEEAPEPFPVPTWFYRTTFKGNIFNRLFRKCQIEVGACDISSSRTSNLNIS